MKKKENLLNGKSAETFTKTFTTLHPPQHLLGDVDFGNEHLHSLTISAKDENGDLFDFNGFRLKLELKIN